jgi:hypothetical protein
MTIDFQTVNGNEIKGEGLAARLTQTERCYSNSRN